LILENQFKYHLANTPKDFERGHAIIVEYLATLGIDLTYMNLPQEFSTLAEKYAAPEGAFILALDGETVIGCAGVRKIDNEAAELKRVYVKDDYRGYKIGISLIKKGLENARELGYNKIRLDVIPTLVKAKKLYQSLGFYEIAPYFENPVPGTVYMEKEL